DRYAEGYSEGQPDRLSQRSPAEFSLPSQNQQGHSYQSGCERGVNRHPRHITPDIDTCDPGKIPGEGDHSLGGASGAENCDCQAAVTKARCRGENQYRQTGSQEKRGRANRHPAGISIRDVDIWFDEKSIDAHIDMKEI